MLVPHIIDTHFVINGCLLLFAVARLKLNKESMESSNPIWTKMGTAARRTDLTSGVNISLGVVVESAAEVRAAVKLLVCMSELNLTPGTEMPKVSSTARTTLTKFFWTVNIRSALAM